MKCESVITRVGKKFDEVMKEIQQERISKNIDVGKKSKAKLTNLIIKHNFFPQIRKEIVDYRFPKRGKEKNEK